MFPQVLFRQPLLDGRLPLDEPVHRRVELMLVDVAEFEHPTEGGDGGLGGEGAGGGELRLRVDDAGDDEGDDEVTDAACAFR